MKIIKEISSILDAGLWECEENIQKLVDAELVEAFTDYIDGSYPEGLTITELNDIVRFEDKFINEFIASFSDDEEYDFEEEEEEC